MKYLVETQRTRMSYGSGRAIMVVFRDSFSIDYDWVYQYMIFFRLHSARSRSVQLSFVSVDCFVAVSLFEVSLEIELGDGSLLSCGVFVAVDWR